MRVLMLAQWYPPLIGGEELHVANLSRALAERGHDVTVATLWHEGLAEEERQGAVRVVRIRGSLQQAGGLFSDTQRRSAAPIAEPALTLALDAVVRRFRPDVMHAHNWLVHAALPIRAARGIPLVQSLHDFSLVCATKVLLRRGEDCSGPGPLKCLDCAAAHYGPVKGPITAVANWSDGLVQRRLVDAFIPVSQAVADGNHLAGLPHRVIPNFIPDATAEAVEAPDHISRLPDEPFVLFVGAVGRLKGIPDLLEAYRRHRDLPRLVLIGYRMRETEELLADPPPNVTVLGEWPHAAVQLAWKAARVGVLPSICKEACPTVVIEAMRAGRPMVATRMGGIPDLVEDGRTGILVPPNDPEALAGALRRLADDPDLAQAMGAAAAERSAAFTASSVVPRIEEVYREVTGATRGDTP